MKGCGRVSVDAIGFVAMSSNVFYVQLKPSFKIALVDYHDETP